MKKRDIFKIAIEQYNLYQSHFLEYSKFLNNYSNIGLPIIGGLLSLSIIGDVKGDPSIAFGSLNVNIALILPFAMIILLSTFIVNSNKAFITLT